MAFHLSGLEPAPEGLRGAERASALEELSESRPAAPAATAATLPPSPACQRRETAENWNEALLLMAEHLEREHKERVASVAALQREVQAQQATLAQLAEQLLGGAGGIEGRLQGLRRDLDAQHEQQDLQAAALRETLLDVREQREEQERQAAELASVCARCDTLLAVDGPGAAAAAAGKLGAGPGEDLASMVLYHEQQFVELVKALEMEREARGAEDAQLRAGLAALAGQPEAVGAAITTGTGRSEQAPELASPRKRLQLSGSMFDSVRQPAGLAFGSREAEAATSIAALVGSSPMLQARATLGGSQARPEGARAAFPVGPLAA